MLQWIFKFWLNPQNGSYCRGRCTTSSTGWKEPGVPPSLPEAGVVADERRGQRAAGREHARAAVVVAVRVDGRHVFHLVEAVRLLVGELRNRFTITHLADEY